MKNTSDIHSVVFVKPYTLYDRHSFLRRHKLKAIKRVHETINTYRYRIIAQHKFKSQFALQTDTKKIKATVRDGQSSGVINLVVGFY